MSDHISFSNEDKEKTSLNFFELRKKGLNYLQEFSGATWTDFNSHDPGVTILEQLCYGLTDVALRSSYSIQDLLTKKNIEGGEEINYKENGFFSPPDIFSSHPVTEVDLKKLLLDNFNDIQNVWIEYTDNSGLEEKVVITKKIEILPKAIFNRLNQANLEKEVMVFLAKHRNLGEDVEKICVLAPRQVSIEMEVELLENKTLGETIANLLVDLFEYIYVPIRRYTLEEILADTMNLADIFSGPKMSYGFIKQDSFKERIKILEKEILQQVLTKRNNNLTCTITKLYLDEKNESQDSSLQIHENEYFDFLSTKIFQNGEDSNDFTQNSLSLLLNNIWVCFGKKKELLKSNEKQNIYHLFYELWTKKYRPYRLEKRSDYTFNKKTKGTFYDIEKYHSIQNQFPSIYAIGADGLPKSASSDRKAKAKQLKAYLLLFEQQLANELSQVSHLDDFFNLSYHAENKKTYYAQNLSSVPNVEEILPKSMSPVKKEQNFYNRKNRIYDHMLARFGESLDPTPFKIRKEHSTMKSKSENIGNTLLIKKSEYLQNISRLSAEGLRGENFLVENSNERKEADVSGLENIILAKTDLPRRKFRDAENNADDTFFIVDHIMLRDFLQEEENIKYGFKFVDALENEICGTNKDKEESWSDNEKERANRVAGFYKVLDDNKGLFHYQNSKNDDGLIKVLRDRDIKEKGKSLVLATFSEDYTTKNQVLELSNLFNKNNSRSTQERWQELEKIRHKGIHIHGRGVFGQRRLTYQRKLINPVDKKEVVVDEDFFNLCISIVLPAAIKSNEFELYLKSLITERVPSHIKLNFYFLEKKTMDTFKKKYTTWEKEKVQHERLKKQGESKITDQLKKDTYEVYNFFRKLKILQRKNQEEKAQFNKLMFAAKNENIEVEKRLEYIKKLNQQVSKYNHQLSIENINSKKITDLTTKYFEDLLKIENIEMED
jgi:hypothetical protein